jgi:hypothetical protein
MFTENQNKPIWRSSLKKNGKVIEVYGYVSDTAGIINTVHRVDNNEIIDILSISQHNILVESGNLQYTTKYDDNTEKRMEYSGYVVDSGESLEFSGRKHIWRSILVIGGERIKVYGRPISISTRSVHRFDNDEHILNLNMYQTDRLQRAGGIIFKYNGEMIEFIGYHVD